MGTADFRDRSVQRVPPDGHIDDPSEVEEWLSKEALSSDYQTIRKLAIDVQEEQKIGQFEIDDLLSRDLLNLSIQDRNKIQEEIHGVHNCALEENPAMINAALRDLKVCIDQLPFTMKTAYVRSQKLYPDTYINSAEFRLKFLRCDLFDAEKAATRMVTFLDLLSELFGDHVLQRPLKITDFSWEEMQVFRIGYFQLLPIRDRSGRRIFASVGGFATQTTIVTRVKILFYLMLTASEDVETQRKGITSVVWPGGKFDAEKSSGQVRFDRVIWMKRVYNNLPVRTCSIHFCFPNTPYMHIFRTAFILTMPQHRKRMKFHTGETVETQYILKGYGIPVELIPLTDTGNIKTIYLKQWLKLRKTLDAMLERGLDSSFSVIECPGSNDVVFRSGTSMSCHPGNFRFRCLLEAATCPTPVALKSTQAELAEKLMLEIEGAGGRFLKWDNKGYWTEITARLQIHTKVALSIRDFKYKNKSQQKNRQNNQSYTYLFVQDGSKRKREDCVSSLKIKNRFVEPR